MIVQRTITTLRADVEAKIHRLPLAYFDSRQRGVVSRVTNDVDNIQTSVSVTVSQLLTAALTLVAVLAMMVVVSPLLALITVALVPLSLLVIARSPAAPAPCSSPSGPTRAGSTPTSKDHSGFTVVRTFGHRASATARFDRLNTDVYHAGLAPNSSRDWWRRRRC